MLFEVGPVFKGKQPGQQNIFASGIVMGDKIEKNWMMKTQAFNAYDV